MTSKNTVSIYGAGGAGINILRKVMNTDLSDMAIVKETYVDGSRSNVGNAHDTDKWYFLSGVDGAGKVRKTNYGVTDRAIDDILIKHKPSGLNIVIFSASGGSGSVIGPKIAEALYAQKKAVLLFVIGSEESGKAADNTHKTLESIHGICTKNGEFGNVCYESNENNSRNIDVDGIMVDAIRGTLDLYSGNHFGLDTADIHMWARPNISAGVRPQLALLEISDNREDITDIISPISVAELHASNESQTDTIPADYNTFGRRTQSSGRSLYFAIYTHGLEKVMAELNERISEFEQRAAARDRLTLSAMKEICNTEEDGMVL